MLKEVVKLLSQRLKVGGEMVDYRTIYEFYIPTAAVDEAVVPVKI